MEIQKIYIGGWFQRTTLHLTEVWDFFKHGKSNLVLPEDASARLRSRLEIVHISRESGPLEFILVKTRNGIDFRMYEDGLIILEKNFEALKQDFERIKDYYDNRLSAALSFIFSKGAPVPKELANIKTILPYILTCANGSREEIAELFSGYSEDIYSVLSTKGIEVHRSPGIILIHNLRDEVLAREIIESQIFFREFKSQLHRYLAIHRTIWEKIAYIKERGKIRGTEIDALRNELGDYQKTVDLIGARINQMGTYLKTRQKLTDLKQVDEYLNPLFQFKFETLANTHEYIKHLWDMTKNYLKSALELFIDLQSKSTKNTISSLQLITTIGVVAAIVGYLGRDRLPTFTLPGLMYFVLLMVMTWALNAIISKIYKGKRYELRRSEIIKNIS